MLAILHQTFVCLRHPTTPSISLHYFSCIMLLKGGVVVNDIATGAGDLGSIRGPVKADTVSPMSLHC